MFLDLSKHIMTTFISIFIQQCFLKTIFKITTLWAQEKAFVSIFPFGGCKSPEKDSVFVLTLSLLQRIPLHCPGNRTRTCSVSIAHIFFLYFFVFSFFFNFFCIFFSFLFYFFFHFSFVFFFVFFIFLLLFFVFFSFFFYFFFVFFHFSFDFFVFFFIFFYFFCIFHFSFLFLYFFLHFLVQLYKFIYINLIWIKLFTISDYLLTLTSFLSPFWLGCSALHLEIQSSSFLQSQCVALLG